MNLHSLYASVTTAIFQAEQAERSGAASDAAAAYTGVSMIEEEIASRLPASDAEGAIARRGAVRAAHRARLYARAAELAERFTTEADVPDALRSELDAMGAAASIALGLDELNAIRIAPQARFHIAA